MKNEIPKGLLTSNWWGTDSVYQGHEDTWDSWQHTVLLRWSCNGLISFIPRAPLFPLAPFLKQQRLFQHCFFGLIFCCFFSLTISHLETVQMDPYLAKTPMKANLCSTWLPQVVMVVASFDTFVMVLSNLASSCQPLRDLLFSFMGVSHMLISACWRCCCFPTFYGRCNSGG